MRAPLIISICLLFFASCKNKQVAVNELNLPPRSPEKLIDALQKGIPNIHYYSAKAVVGIEMGDVDRSVNSHVRSVSDSVLWVSVTPALGIEVARVLLTPDSLKFIEKINDKYFMGTLIESEVQFGIPLDMSLLQDAFKGLPIGLDPELKYRSDRENGQYVLTSKGPRRFVRAAEILNPTDTIDEREDARHDRVMRQAQHRGKVVTKYWIDPQTMLPTRVLIADLSAGTQADVTYLAREEVDGSLLPTKLEVVVSDGDRDARVKLEFSRIRTTGPLNISFRVPDKYEPMEP